MTCVCDKPPADHIVKLAALKLVVKGEGKWVFTADDAVSAAQKFYDFLKCSGWCAVFA